MKILINGRKRIFSFIIAVCLFCISLQAVMADAPETVNPVAFAATAMSNQGEFIVSVKIKEEFVMKAYQFTLQYDASKLEVYAEGGTAYGYFPAFASAYNGNGKGLTAVNLVEEDSMLIFAGAQPQETAATVKAQERCAYVCFRLKTEEKSEEAYLQALEGLTLKVDNLSDGAEDFVKSAPSLFEEPLAVETGDVIDNNELNQTLLGDIDNDGQVSLEDARTILLYALGITDVPEAHLAIADVNHDLKVSIEDARMVLQAALGIITLQ